MCHAFWRCLFYPFCVAFATRNDDDNNDGDDNDDDNDDDNNNNRNCCRCRGCSARTWPTWRPR